MTLGVSAAAAALAASGVIHVMLVRDHHAEAWWLGGAFLLDGAALLLTAGLLVRRTSPRVWRAAAALCGATALAYALSRVRGLPGSHKEQWDSLGIATTVAELGVVCLSLRFSPVARITHRILPAALAATVLIGAAYAAVPPGADRRFSDLNPVTAEFLRSMLRHGHITEADAVRYAREFRR